MNFQRESEGVYRYYRKRVFMKIVEGEQIVIRVGGGYLTMEELVNEYCTGQEYITKARIT